MKILDVIFVKIFVAESSHLAHDILHYLKNEAKIRGVSIFRAVSGFGDSGLHTSTLLDLSLNMPLTIEFFDLPEKIEETLLHLNTLVKSGHIVFWKAQVND